MGWLSIIPSIFSALGEGIKGFFGIKTNQIQAVQQAIGVLTSVDSNDTETRKAAAQIITAEASSSYWLAACWRPLLMLFFASLIGARWFGYMPPNMSPEELAKLYDLVTLGMGGYIGTRSLEKIVHSLNVGKILDKLIK